ncbi:hypothetical protein HMPREF1544_05446 [Mucor circinelloides 1006PhL]|uniref:Uncharacterized protein n=1 Tax=Mucor circinelloides f. circinelloides (strain 1006PhL) TaxID=1220926 RepID=S2JBZ5_MUCC1|nr:hypothetical protein HMPREF1544_05446 [Mucor circinelloides 1006PhL]
MKLSMLALFCVTLPLIEDSADRQQEAALGGAVRGLAIPNIFGIVPQNPLGGQAPDED